MTASVTSRAILLGASLLVSPAFAGPRQDFEAAVAAVQKSPGDAGLREKVIALAKALKPKPAAPKEAEKRMIRGTAAVEGAKTPDDFRAAAREFEAATTAAPWWGDAYYNLAVAQDKAEDYDGALRSLKLAALASPGSPDAEKLSYAVEFRKEKALDSPEAQAARQAAKDAAILKSLDGAVFAAETFPGKMEVQWRVAGTQLRRWNRRLSGGRGYCLCDQDNLCSGPPGEEAPCAFEVTLQGRRAENVERMSKSVWEISEDGRTLTINTTYNGNPMAPETFTRR